MVARAARPADVIRLVDAAGRLRGAFAALLGQDDAMTNPEPACNTVAWCEGRCDPTLDEHGTVLVRVHSHSRKFDGPAELAQLTAEPDEALAVAEAARILWVDHDGQGRRLLMPLELSIDQAEQLAAALAAAMSVARRAEQ